MTHLTDSERDEIRAWSELGQFDGMEQLIDAKIQQGIEAGRKSRAARWEPWCSWWENNLITVIAAVVVLGGIGGIASSIYANGKASEQQLQDCSMGRETPCRLALIDQMGQVAESPYVDGEKTARRRYSVLQAAYLSATGKTLYVPMKAEGE